MGRAIVLAFAAAGAKVVAADIGEDGGNETVALAKDAGANDVAFVRTDVANSADVTALVGAAVDRFGGLHCAVNAAAIEFETVAVAELPDDDFDRMMAVNVRSVFLCMKHEIRAMLAAGDGGAIVNIASTNAFKAQPNQPAYTASKHAVLGLTRATALDYAPHRIRVNAICPGAIDTPMLRGAMARRNRDPEETARRLSPLSRFGQPNEIAQAALWLCSDQSSFTTGHALSVDGGYLSR
jgi:glucose 1-dehydrogenase